MKALEPESPQETVQVARMLAGVATVIKLSSDTIRGSIGVTQRELHTTNNDDLPELSIVNFTEEEMNDIRSKAHAASVGVDDGLGGVLDENEVVEEGFSGEPEVV